VTEAAAGIPPFDQLEGVLLGMRPRQLATRPNVEAAPYYGFREKLASYEILYAVPGSMDEGQAPPDNSRLVRVIARQSFAEDRLPVEEWRHAVKRFTAAFGLAPTCYRDSSDRTVWEAVWSRGPADVVVSAFNAANVPGERLPASLSFGMARRGEGRNIRFKTATPSPRDVMVATRPSE
jgi:hypothetical protein